MSAVLIFLLLFMANVHTYAATDGDDHDVQLTRKRPRTQSPSDGGDGSLPYPDSGSKRDFDQPPCSPKVDSRKLYQTATLELNRATRRTEDARRKAAAAACRDYNLRMREEKQRRLYFETIKGQFHASKTAQECLSLEPKVVEDASFWDEDTP